MEKLIALMGLIALSGCAHTQIVPTGQDSYMISRQGGYGQTSSATVLADAYQDASSFCKDKGLMLQPVSTHEDPFYFGHTAEASMHFMCLSKGDSQLNRPMMQDTVSPGPQPAAAPVQMVMPVPQSTFTPMQPYQMKLPTNTHCNSNAVGGTIYSNCSSY